MLTAAGVVWQCFLPLLWRFTQYRHKFVAFWVDSMPDRIAVRNIH
jgi:hypothetical protein